MSNSQESIQTVSSLLAYFREELITAFEKTSVETSEDTEAYLVHLLDGFSRIDPASAEEVGFDKPAAFYLGEAMNSPGEQRIEAFRRLGDASLFNCGFFAGYISRRLVDAEYYQGIGRLSYQKLTQLMAMKSSGEMFRGIFEELTDNFEGVVESFRWLGRSLQADGIDLGEDLQEKLDSRASGGAKSLQAAGISFSNDEGRDL